jgi:hypothetical protein
MIILNVETNVNGEYKLLARSHSGLKFPAPEDLMGIWGTIVP